MNPEPDKAASGIGVAENIVFEAETFWERHKQRLLGGAAIVLVAGVGVGLWFWGQRQESIQAQKVMAEAKATEDLAKVAEQYPGTPAAAEALLRQGDIAAQAGQWDASVGAYRKFLDLFQKHPLAANALMGLGGAHEAMGRYPEAEDAYRRVFEEHRESHRAAEARLALGELLKAQGRDREAREAFDTLMSVYPQSVWVQLARREIESLDRKSGVPAQTPAAPTPAAAPAQSGAVTPAPAKH
ncbi:MAG: tetratricopeptide repeat protein [Verrucomicrobiae bacterium]|nr:tetratricopeptide repeat protein [Verrucomicrobiae bacterium]